MGPFSCRLTLADLFFGQVAPKSVPSEVSRKTASDTMEFVT